MAVTQEHARQSIDKIQSGPVLMQWRKEHKISRSLFAKVADVSERTLADYEGRKALPAKSIRPVTEAVRLIQALADLAGDDVALKEWLNQPNPAFDKQTPLSLIVSGKSDVLWKMAYQIRGGSFA